MSHPNLTESEFSSQAEGGAWIASNRAVVQWLTTAFKLIFLLHLLLTLYIFSRTDAKPKQEPRTEETKETGTKQKDTAGGHKCTDPNCQQHFGESDMRVDEDEVFDEQADVVFMQPGFNIKDAHENTSKSQKKPANPQYANKPGQTYKQPYTNGQRSPNQQ